MLLALMLAVQDPAPDPKIAARIEELIAKTDQYEHFVARYRIRGDGRPDAELRLSYSAPDRARLQIEAADARVDMVFRDTVCEMCTTGGNEAPTYSRVRNSDAEPVDRELVRARLRELIPGTAPEARPAGKEHVIFRFSIPSDCSTFDFNLGMGSGPLCVWLEQLSKDKPKLEWADADHAQIVWSPCEDKRILLSAENGFVVRLEKGHGDSRSIPIELLELDVAGGGDPALYGSPQPAEGARDDSAEAEAGFSRAGFKEGRRELFYTLARRLDAGGVEWSEARADGCGAILRAIAERELPTIARSYSARIEAMGKRVAEVLAEGAAGDPAGLEQVRGGAAQSRERVEQQLSKDMDSLYASRYPPGYCKSRPALSDELTAIEKRWVGEAYAELVTKPVLAEFDAKVAKLLEGK